MKPQIHRFPCLTRPVEVSGICQMALVGYKADIVVRPAVAQWNYLDFRPTRAIAEAG